MEIPGLTVLSQSTTASKSGRGAMPRKWWRRARYLLDGEVAQYSPQKRARVLAWQEPRVHRARSRVLGVLLAFATLKVVLVLAGTWPTESHAAVYAALWLVLAGSARAHARARSLATEGGSAMVFVLALLFILADPMTNWPDRPAKSMGILLLLPVIGIPLLVRLGSALAFSGFCIVIALGYFFLTPSDEGTRNAVLLNLGISVTAGLRLRVARSDMSAGFMRSMQSALLRANTDALTGLLNRHGWSQAAASELERAQASRTAVTLLFLDIDHFKQLNDRRGHAAGDQALGRMGNLIQSRLQGRALAARIGGEEFVCLLPGQNAAQAHRLAQRLRADLAHGHPAITFSAGVAAWDGNESLSKLMRRADEAMYRAKQAGRDRVMDASLAEPPGTGT